MKSDIREQKSGDAFSTSDFSNWKKNYRLTIHVEGSNSAHNKAWGNCTINESKTC